MSEIFAFPLDLQASPFRTYHSNLSRLRRIYNTRNIFLGLTQVRYGTSVLRIDEGVFLLLWVYGSGTPTYDAVCTEALGID
jgi:hypothetical protein